MKKLNIKKYSHTINIRIIRNTPNSYSCSNCMDGKIIKEDKYALLYLFKCNKCFGTGVKPIPATEITGINNYEL